MLAELLHGTSYRDATHVIANHELTLGRQIPARLVGAIINETFQIIGDLPIKWC
jgi:hypothetical protein